MCFQGLQCSKPLVFMCFRGRQGSKPRVFTCFQGPPVLKASSFYVESIKNSLAQTGTARAGLARLAGRASKRPLFSRGLLVYTRRTRGRRIHCLHYLGLQLCHFVAQRERKDAIDIQELAGEEEESIICEGL